MAFWQRAPTMWMPLLGRYAISSSHGLCATSGCKEADNENPRPEGGERSKYEEGGREAGTADIPESARWKACRQCDSTASNTSWKPETTVHRLRRIQVPTASRPLSAFADTFQPRGSSSQLPECSCVDTQQTPFVRTTLLRAPLLQLPRTMGPVLPLLRPRYIRARLRV